MTPEQEKKLIETARDLAKTIDWLTPFLSAKAKESGDVAGLRTNATNLADETRTLLNWIERDEREQIRSLANG